jgi:glycosyltransferase involved in cell wall biosynthesis
MACGSVTNRPIRVGIDLTGMSGVASGVRTRAEKMIEALSTKSEHVELHLLSSEPWVAELASRFNLCMHVSPTPTRFQRLVGTGRRVRRFTQQCDLQVLQIEAPPVPRRRDVPVVFSLHDIRSFDVPVTSLRSVSDLYQRLTLKRSVKHASTVLALTEYMKKQFEERLGTDSSKIVVVPPGRPDAERHPGFDVNARGANETRPVRTGQPFVLCLGHLEERKNLAVMVEAIDSSAWPDGVDLVIAGRDGGVKRDLMEAAARLSKDKCHFIGPVGDDEKWELLHHALVVAIPSTIEGFGIVALEANAGGTPVLAADASALPEVVGLSDTLLPSDSPVAWAEGVARLASSEQWRTRVVREQSDWMSRFSWEASTRRLVAVYDTLTTNGRPDAP